jgi:precorrin-8X/cobalt-precorrin-8 methylmutase
VTTVHPIEAESFRILEGRVDLSRFGPLSRAVVARVVHASADVELAGSMVVDDASVERGIAAIRAGAPVVVDVEMVRAGIVGIATECHLAEATGGPTRSAAAMRLAAERHPRGAVFVVGCAPTALGQLLDLDVEPALVVGLPVGFVGAAEAKAGLRARGWPAISNVGEKGGSAVAAAAVNAMVRLARG